MSTDDPVRIRLKEGEREIELEGDIRHVNEFLDRLWLKEKSSAPPKAALKNRPTKPKESGALQPSDQGPSIDYAAIVNKIHDCAEAESIDKKILRGKSRVNRVLLPLYMRLVKNKPALSIPETD